MRRTFHGANPVGRHVDKNAMIVGVVEDVPVAPGLDVAAPLAGEPTLYVPATQVDAQSLSLGHMWFQPSWIVRTSTQGSGTVDELTALMQRALASVDPSLPFSGFYSMRDLLVKTLATQRFEVALLGSMAALALLLSAVGIFSLVANLVAQRTREIGIRMALGSTIGRAMAHVGRSGAGASAIGLLLGLILCGGVLGAMRSVVYGVAVYDTATICSVVLLLLLVTLVAVIVPALRIARIDPARTLREE
jgi:ABC-type antimicrobial peptide transport system permease subunit